VARVPPETLTLEEGLYRILVHAIRGIAAVCLTLVCSWAVLCLGVRECRGDDISVEELAGRLDRTMHRIAALEGAIGPEDGSWLEERFPDGTRVWDEDGRAIRMDRETLLHWIRQAKETLEGRSQLLVYLRALRAQLGGQEHASGNAASDWTGRLGMLDSVYEASEFRYLRDRDTPDWTKAIVEAARAVLEWLASHLEGVGPTPRKWIQVAVYGLVLGSGALLILWVLRASRGVGWKRRSLPGMGPGIGIRLGDRDWTSWHREASERAGRGAYREAVRCLFISVLLKGHDQGWWVYETQSTNREHLARVAGPLPRREALGRLVDMYERTWYGLGEPREGEFRDFESWARRVEGAT
jgi:hypothetical protein